MPVDNPVDSVHNSILSAIFRLFPLAERLNFSNRFVTLP